MPKQPQEPRPARSTGSTTFDDLRKDIAQRNEQASQKARKLRAARDQAQIIARRQWERLQKPPTASGGGG